MAQSHRISFISPLAHSLLSLFSSIHPDYTSNGFSSQQPPTVMELCLNEQLCLSTSPLFSLSLLFFVFLNTHSSLPFLICTEYNILEPMEKDKSTAFSYLECVCSWLQLERVPQRIYPLCETLHSGVKVVNHLLLCPVFPQIKML